MDCSRCQQKLNHHGQQPRYQKDDTTCRAVDYKQLNQETIGDAYPLSNISENLDKLQGSIYFSSLDAVGVYNTVPVEESSKPFLAFTSPFGSFTYHWMPFGA